jgi:hypothetical protein
VNDAEARDYSIQAFGEIAAELRFWRDPRSSSLADRCLAAAERLRDEQPVELEDVLNDFERRLVGLEETVDALGRRVIGGPPPAGVVPVDGPELEREPEAPLAGG